MAASLQGAQVEGLLRKVDVKAGETYFIPAGMVHAIGAGIVLYEIQQSSDVTYRFYDWERTDKNGNKRELHLEKAVAVTDVTTQLNAAAEKEIAPGHFRLLDEKYFQLDRLADFDGVLPADNRRFAFITATGKTTLSWENGTMELPMGRTAFLPADGYDVKISSQGALISYPSVQ